MFMIVCKIQIQSMRSFIANLDDEIHKNQAKKEKVAVIHKG